MLDLRALVSDSEAFERRLARRGEKVAAALAPVKALAGKRRELNVAIEGLKKRQSEAASKVGELMRKDKAQGEKARAEARA
ncbi:MAG TPA: serine--tRNA ligase, partial [Anaeromyxobacteraceae bacterium]|nr:serine--tRNA ligase [Anaeromyxobacteraceae bacterium]